MGRYGGHASRVAHEDDLVCQLFWFQVEVEDAPVAVDDQFGGFDCSSHGGEI